MEHPPSPTGEADAAIVMLERE
jgi:hypothetical protein